MVKGKKCPCGKSGTCPNHSALKMVAYDKNDRKTVWYSFFKEDRKFARLETLADSMSKRYKKMIKQHGKLILFYDNINRQDEPLKAVNL